MSLYGPAMTAATYARLHRLAAVVLKAGWPAILDATFLRRHQRVQARRLAAKCGAAFVILDFEVDVETLRQRLRRRKSAGRDPSDADESVLNVQLRTSQPLQADERMAVFACGSSASTPDEPVRADWMPLLRRLGQ